MAALGFRTDLLEMAGPMMDTQTRMHENISALADGELAASELELAFAALDTTSGRQAWEAYQHIGHVLRSAQCGAELRPGFEARLAVLLASEAAHTQEAAAASATSATPAPPLKTGPVPQR